MPSCGIVEGEAMLTEGEMCWVSIDNMPWGPSGQVSMLDIVTRIKERDGWWIDGIWLPWKSFGDAGFRCAACGCLRYPWGRGLNAAQLTEPEGSWLFRFQALA